MHEYVEFLTETGPIPMAMDQFEHARHWTRFRFWLAARRPLTPLELTVRAYRENRGKFVLGFLYGSRYEWSEKFDDKDSMLRYCYRISKTYPIRLP